MGTTANQKLRLKKPNGWFPAGDGFLEAITGYCQLGPRWRFDRRQKPLSC
jgi:hypothetical protein